VVVQIGNTLWVTNDETISLERLTYQGVCSEGVLRYGSHTQFSLDKIIELPVPPATDPKDTEEADVEGLDYDKPNHYLWVVGSHSLKRKKADEDEGIEENFKRLSDVSGDGNRFLLARIPIVEAQGTYTLTPEVWQDGERRTAAKLRGDDTGDELTKALAQDKHVRKFLAIPGKDNGFGYCVAGLSSSKCRRRRRRLTRVC
jgi:hypothetical protein